MFQKIFFTSKTQIISSHIVADSNDALDSYNFGHCDVIPEVIGLLTNRAALAQQSDIQIGTKCDQL